MHKQIPASQIKPGMTYMTHYGPRVVTDALPALDALIAKKMAEFERLKSRNLR